MKKILLFLVTGALLFLSSGCALINTALAVGITYGISKALD